TPCHERVAWRGHLPRAATRAVAAFLVRRALLAERQPRCACASLRRSCALPLALVCRAGELLTQMALDLCLYELLELDVVLVDQLRVLEPIGERIQECRGGAHLAV